MSTKTDKHTYIGASFEDYLEEEGILEEIDQLALKEIKKRKELINECRDSNKA